MTDPKPWKTKSQKTVLDHVRLKVLEDIVELPNGKTTTYVRHAPSDVDSVAVIAINSKNQILLQREYSYPPNKVMWQLPGGSMNSGESIVTAALRELAEESNYSAKQTKLLGSFYVHNRLSDKQQHLVLCTDVFEYSLPEDHDEFIESHWLSKRKVIALLKQGEFDNINLLAGLTLWLNQPKG